MKDAPRKEWHANNAMRRIPPSQQHIQSSNRSAASTARRNDSDTKDDEEEDNHTASASSSFAQLHAAQFAESASLFRNGVLLDNQSSSSSVYCNKDLVANIKPSTRALEILTNTGSTEASHRATVGPFGKVWHNPNGIANILSFAEVKDHKDCKLKHDDTADEFRVKHSPAGKITTFKREGKHCIWHPLASDVDSLPQQ